MAGPARTFAQEDLQASDSRFHIGSRAERQAIADAKAAALATEQRLQAAAQEKLRLAKLNEALGEVYHTAPTEEMFEQAVELEQEAEVGQEVSAWGQSTWGDSGGGGGGGGTSEW
mgnify:CR=1 FL=1